jgi:hypothetical protein
MTLFSAGDFFLFSAGQEFSNFGRPLFFILYLFLAGTLLQPAPPFFFFYPATSPAGSTFPLFLAGQRIYFQPAAFFPQLAGKSADLGFSSFSISLSFFFFRQAHFLSRSYTRLSGAAGDGVTREPA